MSPERDKRIYELAKKFLMEEFEKYGDNAQTLEIHLKPKEMPKNLNDVYNRLLDSAQTAERMPKVIASGVGKFENLGEILFQFNYLQVLAKYGNNDEELYSDITKKFQIKSSEKTWRRYSKTMLSGAKFLSQFKDYNDFDLLVKSFPTDERAQYSAALFLDKEIFGFGLALSCDFLKGIGYTRFGKPDVIVKRIFKSIRLIEAEIDYEVLKAIGRVAKNNDVTSYEVDMVFWLIGSSKIYLKTGEQITLPGQKNREDRFVKLANLI